MKWSLQIGRVAGIPLRVHGTFPLLLLWVAGREYYNGQDWRAALLGLVMVCILFAIIVLHELGHALTARRYGIVTHDITLLPIGGVARLDHIPEHPRQELLVALAGPAVNVCLAIIFFVLLQAAIHLPMPPAGNFLLREAFATLMWINIVLTVFNLLPVFPMDGGRLLRALLATRLPYVRATRIAASTGRALALVLASLGLASFFFGTRGLFSNPFLLVLGAFVWVAAGQESALVQVRGLLGGVTVAQVMRTNFRSLSPREPLITAAQQMLSGWQNHFPVIDHGTPVGLVSGRQLLDGLAEHGYSGTVRDATALKVATVESTESADSVISSLSSAPLGTMLVLRDGQPVGMLTQGSVREYLAIRRALGPEIAREHWQAQDREAA